MTDTDADGFLREPAPDGGGRSRRHTEQTVMPVDWPDFTLPQAAPLRHPVAVAVESLTLRPLDLHLALATLRLRLPVGIDVTLRVSVAPVDPSASQVKVLRTHLHHEQCPPHGCVVEMPASPRSCGGVSLELRLEGARVGMTPPALHVRASVVHRTRDGMDEAMTTRQITPRLSLPDDMRAAD
jgi:hypothetical protein